MVGLNEVNAESAQYLRLSHRPPSRNSPCTYTPSWGALSAVSPGNTYNRAKDTSPQTH